MGSLAGPLSGNSSSVQGAVLSAALGGVSSVLGGGKFENGAVTGAFAYAAPSLIDSQGGQTGGLAKSPTGVCDPTDGYACTDISLTTDKVETQYNPQTFPTLDPVGQAGTKIHEEVIHKAQEQDFLSPWVPAFISKQVLHFAYGLNPGSFEIPAYQSEVNFYTKYISNPNNPYSPAVFDDLFDAQSEIEKYQSGKR